MATLIKTLTKHGFAIKDLIVGKHVYATRGKYTLSVYKQDKNYIFELAYWGATQSKTVQSDTKAAIINRRLDMLLASLG